MQQLLNLGSAVVMARLLSPEDFGLLSMASVFTGIVYVVLDLGLGAALVQRKNIEPQHVSSIFWMNVSVGLCLSLMGIALSWPIAIFYKTPAVQWVIAALACCFSIAALGSTQEALLTRKMHFRALEFRRMLSHLVGIITGLIMAYLGWGVWSLVGRIVITSLLGTALLWYISSWRPTWKFRWVDVREMSGFSNDVLGGNLLGYVGRNADNLLIGRFLGAIELGFYSMAYNLMTAPLDRIAQVLAGVLFPALSRQQENLSKVKQSWFRASQLVVAVVIPLVVGLILLAPELVQVFYGEKWLPAVPILQILAVRALVVSLKALDGTVLMAIGQTRLRLNMIALSVGVAVLSFLIGIPFGIRGVALSFTSFTSLISMIGLYLTLKCVNSSFVAYFGNLSGILFATAGMTVGVFTMKLIWLDSAVNLLMTAILLGGILYLRLLQLMAPDVIQQGIGILPNHWANKFLRFSTRSNSQVP
ncbi:lipopolysaccharide biosynthesis protein [Synechococcus bigranulatus str. 'Rupite']|uniref:Lipopolysaccharide biosynthesis protein n=2 Tax=Thermostichus vulcanus TaxID=32053 RepID=A0ABT0C6C5_THEVL|nr:lipopolysaccharide biosynthesis protein [Thermostichus vulcanus str. 'Rupite']